MSNPLLRDWNTPYQLPPFSDIQVAHYQEAFEKGFEQQNQEVDAIVASSHAPTFANTIEALEQSGSILNKVSPLFYAMQSSVSTPELRQAQSEVVPLHSEHTSQLMSRADLYARVNAVFENELDALNPEQQQLLKQTRSQTQRAGASLNEEQAARIVEIDTELSRLQTQFGQNVLGDANEFELVLEENELEGLPESVKQIGANEAEERNQPGKYVFTIARSSFTPFMQYATNREHREKMWLAYTHCANNDNEFNNQQVASTIAKLRAERAELMGYASHADFILDDRMAENTESVLGLLDQIWSPAKQRAIDEACELQVRIQEEGGNFELAPWDWWYYSEKVRKAKFDLDGERLKPYFELERVRDGAFQVATDLYGITFEEQEVELYHPEAKAFEVREANGEMIGLFITDYHLRPSKKAGAWMNVFRTSASAGQPIPSSLTPVTSPRVLPAC